MSQSPVPAATICSIFLRRAQCFLVASLLADVDGDADHSQHAAGGVAHEAGRVQQRDVVTVVVPDPVLQRDHGFGVAVEPLTQQRLVFRVYQRGPVDSPRQLLGLVSQDPFHAFARGQSSLGIDLVDHAAQFTGHGPESLVARGQGRFTNLARGDVDHEPEYATGRTVRPALDHVGAIERPMPAAVGVAEAVFRFEHVRRWIHAPQPLAEFFDLLFGIGAEQLPPGVDVGAAERRVDAEDVVIAVGVIGLVVLDIPVPDAGGS
jgi:hypothetical protein